MKNKKIILNVILLSLTFIIGILIIYSEISKIIEKSKESNFDTIKADIFESAKDKYNDENDATEYKIYKVSDLIKEGYITKDSIEEGYNENSKVLITNQNGEINYYFINGDTLLNIIKNKKDYNNILNENGNYIFVGKNWENYISFNQEIYRIIMVDSNGYIHIIKDLCDENIKKANIDDYLISYYNDKYTGKNKKLIDNGLSIIDNDTYEKTNINNETYINSSSDIWIKKDNDYKIITTDTLEIIENSNEKTACVKVYLKLKNTSLIEKGNGTQFNPYVINVQNY